MASETTYICDRCKLPAIENRSRLTVQCGSLIAAGIREAHLCGDCTHAFVSFMREGRPELATAGK